MSSKTLFVGEAKAFETLGAEVLVAILVSEEPFHALAKIRDRPKPARDIKAILPPSPGRRGHPSCRRGNIGR